MPGNPFDPVGFAKTAGQMGPAPSYAGSLAQNMERHQGLIAQAGGASRDIQQDLFMRRLKMRDWIDSLQAHEQRRAGKYGAMGALLGTGMMLPFMGGGQPQGPEAPPGYNIGDGKVTLQGGYGMPADDEIMQTLGLKPMPPPGYGPR